LAERVYGPESALPGPLLRSWFEKNSAIFRIATASDGALVGYISSIPLLASRFEFTVEPDFNEKSIKAEDIDASLCPSGGGVFISSIVVAPEHQMHSAASLLLRMALVEDLINECTEENRTLRISAQALSKKGEACMKSLGMEAYGVATTGWSIFYGELRRAALQRVQKELQRKYSARFEQSK
jgi:hypothetical protein